MQFDARTVIVGFVVAAVMLSAFHTMLRSTRYNAEPQWVRWAWTILYWALALAAGLIWLQMTP
jgi:multisubunit Na+/H+ antiporter MnhE subunit